MPSLWTFDPSWLSDATRVGWMLGGCDGRMRRSLAERRVKTWGSYRHSVHPPTQWSLCPAGGLGRRLCLQGENRIPLSPVGSGSPQLPWLRSWRPKTPLNLLLSSSAKLLVLVFSSLCARDVANKRRREIRTSVSRLTWLQVVLQTGAGTHADME